jgi:hypothetical protein
MDRCSTTNFFVIIASENSLILTAARKTSTWSRMLYSSNMQRICLASSPKRQVSTFDTGKCPVITSRNKGRLSISLNHTTLVARALVLIAADFLVLTLALLHERCQFGVVVLGNGLGRHLDLAVSTSCCNACLDISDGLFEACDTDGLVETLRRKDCRG